MLAQLKQSINEAAVSGIEVPEKGTVARRYRFTPLFPGFTGHFPGRPILPAILQILTAMTLLEEQAGAELELTRVENAKFLVQLGPDQEIEVRCRERLLGGSLRHEARITAGDSLAATFLLTVIPREEHG